MKFPYLFIILYVKLLLSLRSLCVRVEKSSVSKRKLSPTIWVLPKWGLRNTSVQYRTKADRSTYVDILPSALFWQYHVSGSASAKNCVYFSPRVIKDAFSFTS